jgi:hypothetical protein
MNVCATNHSQFKRSSSRIFYFLFLSAALQATVFSFPFGTFLATRPRTTRHAPRVGSPPFHSLLVRRSCRRPAPARSPDLRPPARLSLSSRPAPGARAKLLLAVMRWRGGALLLLLLAAFFVVAVAEVSQNFFLLWLSSRKLYSLARRDSPVFGSVALCESTVKGRFHFRLGAVECWPNPVLLL